MLDQPKTREMVKILAALGADLSALIVTDEPDDNLIKSVRNLPGIKTIPASLLSVVDPLSHKLLLITVAAVRKVEQLWGQEIPQGEANASV
jgi:large subunit ribosomal protein L4